MESTPDSQKTDTLNDIGVLKRREIEARIVAPLMERFAEEFGAERVTDIARETVVEVARSQGAVLAEMMGGNDLATFADSMENWTKGGALEIEVQEQSDTTFAFNVVQCQYAEMYRGLDIAELGALLSCNRDGTMVEGFNPNIKFERNQTIMGGASHCDFRYSLDPSEVAVDLESN
tara:strand:+ start:3848 stop:4375 length:528 start_codon:yes stop_codon:yes gene_type:complete